MTQAVGPNVRISGAPIGPRSESDIRVDFRDPRRIVAASNALDTFVQAQFFSSNARRHVGSVDVRPRGQ